MPKPIGKSGRYMPGIDGLRAIAVLAVIAYHLNLPGVPGGLLGVGIFFVLSGYLITDILLKQHNKTGRLDLGDFWIRRARRLLPAMFIMLGLVAAYLMATDPPRLYAMKGEIVSALLYYSNWRLIFHNVSYFESFGPPSPLGHLWSLAVEEQFYLVWPIALVLLIRGVKRRGRLVLVILAGAAASAALMAMLYVPGLDPSRVYYGTDTRAFGLLIGAALAVLWPSWKLSEAISFRGRLTVDLIGFAGFAVVVFMIATVGEYDASLYRGGMVIVSVATAMVVAAMAHPASRFARWIGAKPLQWLGARSYGIYLYHYPVIALTTPTAEVDEFHPLRALLQVAASIALAELSWRFLEEPIRHGALGKLRKAAGKRMGTTGGKRRRGLMLACICALVIASVSCSNPNSLVQGDNGNATANGQNAGHGGDTGGGIVDAGANGGNGSQNTADGTAAQPGDGSDPGKQGNVPDGNGTDGGAGNGSGTSTGNVDSGSSAGSGNNGDDNASGTGGAAAGDGSGSAVGGNAGDGKASGSGGAAAGNGQSGSGGQTTGDASGSGGKTGGASSGTHGNGGTKPDPGANGGTKPKPPTNPPIAKDGITIIGDSVILDAKPFLEKLIPGVVVDGMVGRQLTQAVDVVTDLKNRHQLGGTVVLELGTNGSFTEKQLGKLMDAIGDDHTIYFVNTRVPRKWQDVVNTMLSDTVAANPDTKLIDWYAASKGHEDFFGKDGVHLKRSGGEFFANLIASAL